MAEDFDDGPDFFFDAPVWVVAPRRAAMPQEGSGGEVILADESAACRVRCDGTVAVAIFTDADLAEQFASKRSAARGREYVPIIMPTIERFCAFIQRAEARGETHISPDPTESDIRLATIRDALDYAAGRDGEELGDGDEG